MVHSAPPKSAAAFGPKEMFIAELVVELLNPPTLMMSGLGAVELLTGEQVVVSRGKVRPTVPIRPLDNLANFGPFLWRLLYRSMMKEVWIESDSTVEPETELLSAVTVFPSSETPHQPSFWFGAYIPSRVPRTLYVDADAKATAETHDCGPLPTASHPTFPKVHPVKACKTHLSCFDRHQRHRLLPTSGKGPDTSVLSGCLWCS